MSWHLILLLAGAGGVAFGGIFFLIGYIRMRMVRDWVTTTGMVVNRDGSTVGLPALYPTFRWRDARGHEHEHTSMVRSSFGPRPGTLVTVRYDPRTPYRGMMAGPAQGGMLFVIIGCFIAGVAVVVVMVLWFLLRQL